jgi:hypothetical protein
VNRFVAAFADALDAIVHGEAPPWWPHALVFGAALLLTAAGGALAITLLDSGQDGSSVPSPASAERSPAASPDRSAGPTDGVAGSRLQVVDFDALATDSPIDGWALSDGARLLTAAQPTAVDRSARLDGEGAATACQELDIEMARFRATFMIDRVPAGEVAVLTLRLDGGSDHRLTVTDGRATTAPAGEAVALEPYRWYRWEVTYQEDVVRLALLRVDGTVLTEDASRPQASEPRATEFCMTAAPQTRLYLSDLTLEAR